MNFLTTGITIFLITAAFVLFVGAIGGYVIYSYFKLLNELWGE